MTAALHHGTWWDRKKAVPVEKIMEGRFTRLFPDAPAAEHDGVDLVTLAGKMTAAPEAVPTKETDPDPEENSGITSFYTYFGQFLDHDLTLDPTSRLRGQPLSSEQLKDLVNFRTPRFDLDSLYGRGPDEQPYLYQKDGIRLQLGEPMTGNPHDQRAKDLPRGPNHRALIGDPRNDENRIVSQLHATMLRFHNAIAHALPAGTSFAEVRQQVLWHYQWVIVHDFLPTVIQPGVVAEVFPHLGAGGPAAIGDPVFRIEVLRGHGLPLMPVEFSVAAYRFGHSMIRPIYRINETIGRRQIFSTAADPAGDLGGFRLPPDDWAVDWQFFLDLDHGATPSAGIGGDDQITRKPQPSYKIDASLVNPLGLLPKRVASDPSSLALRNLERGALFGLPSGETVATLLGVPPIDPSALRLGKAVEAELGAPLGDVIPTMAGNTPLWTYVLAEAQVSSWALGPAGSPRNDLPVRLGPVGGHLVAEVFAALLKGDATSLLNAGRSFSPLPALCHAGSFGLAELVNAALTH